jgi:hypothetical protein
LISATRQSLRRPWAQARIRPKSCCRSGEGLMQLEQD